MEYFSDLKAKLIYVFRINDGAHRNCLKIGEATLLDGDISLPPNSSALNKSARARIDQYTKTAGIAYDLLYTEGATFVRNGRIACVNDKQVHDILIRSGIKRKEFAGGGSEWFVCDLETAKRAIAAAKSGRKALSASEITDDRSPIIFRPEQREAIDKTLKQYKKGTRMLWNAKMRFGKTLSALQVVKEYGKFSRVLILTHRPVVDGGWFEDFQKIFYDTPDFSYGSKNNGETFSALESRCRRGLCRYVYFASMQDLRGSELVGGNFEKNDEVFATPWDLIIVDEAHEGTQTELGRAVLAELLKPSTKLLELSGTPFNLLDDRKEDEIYTWDYVMEQRAKREWDLTHPGDHNPYAGLPALHIYTYDLGRLMNEYADEDIAFNFREFFRTSDTTGDFIHRDHVSRFLDLLTKTDEESLYPFANDRYRAIFRHTLWMVPGVKSARALSAMLKSHPVFQHFEIVNVAGDGDDDEANDEALRMVEKAIGPDPDATRTITLSCGRLTTGVSVKPWTGVFMLSGSYNTAAAAYMQTIFRVQTPATINGRVKEDCYVFDFAPDRTLKVLAETAKISTKAGKQAGSDRQQLGEFLNFCPIISVEGSQMRRLDTDRMLQQLKRVYVERVVRNGFEDGYLYNDVELMKISDVAIEKFKNLRGIVGTTKAMARTNDITVNDQGLTDEQYAEKERLEKKKRAKKELTPEEQQKLENLKKSQKLKEDAISILRGISIRMPLLIYGAEIADEDKELTIDNFTSLVDNESWEEFMPKGVTKELFNSFEIYYDPDIFTAAGKRIRAMARAADRLSVEERIERIASIFSSFRNPDKETVLTPWRVVNMHMADTLGGYTFFNEQFSETIEEPRFVDHGAVTSDVFEPNAHLLEINSKSGLYPLYLAYNIYRARLRDAMFSPETLEQHQAIWDESVANNIFVICKTPMAKSITRRTLLGFRKGRTNMWAPEDLINKIKNQPELFIKKVRDLVGKNVKIKAIVGNPPYQVMDGGGAGTSAISTYHLFIDMAKKLVPSYISMICPARWYTGGKGLDDFRESMLSDTHLSRITDYPNPKDCFPTANISGGVCYFLWDKEYVGNCKFTNIVNGRSTTGLRPLNEFDVFVRYNDAVSIIHKVYRPESETLIPSIFARNAFGLDSSVRGSLSPSDYNDIAVYSSKGVGYLNISDLKGNRSIVPKYKTLMGKVLSGHVGETDACGQVKVISTTLIAGPGAVTTDSYLVMGVFDTSIEASNLRSYLHTKFVRFLLLQSLASMNISRGNFRFVPLQDFTSSSDIDWSKSDAEIDAQLYAKYGLTDEEIFFIESMIKPM